MPCRRFQLTSIHCQLRAHLALAALLPPVLLCLLGLAADPRAALVPHAVTLAVQRHVRQLV